MSQTELLLKEREETVQRPAAWNDWRWQLSNRIMDRAELEKIITLSPGEKRAIDYADMRFKMAITPYWASNMDREDPSCPIRKQAIPSMKEFVVSEKEMDDPCGEEKDEVTPGLVHRYPDRVLFIVTDTCAMYCRHCTRRRIVGSREGALPDVKMEMAFEYIRNHEEIRDVLLSGGDPLSLSDSKLDSILSELRSISHVEIIRIGSRIPASLPQRITPQLSGLLKKHHPLYISLHFNHPKEITPEVKTACNLLSDSGIPLGSQTVLLKGINDNARVMTDLMQELLKIRVRPYYIYQCDLARGTEGFRTGVDTGMKIMESLRGYTTGYAVPTYVIDAPGGGGKVPVSSDNIVARSDGGIYIKNYRGDIYFYPDK